METFMRASAGLGVCGQSVILSLKQFADKLED
jgi:hypothetical protein